MVSGGNGDDYGIARLFLALIDLPDTSVMAIVSVVMGETLAAGSTAVAAAGTYIGVDMAAWWTADDALFTLVRDREVLGGIVSEVAGETVASANAGEKGKTLKRIVRDHLEGNEGRAKVDGWVPRWMQFPPSAYTARGGVATVTAHARVEAARAEPASLDHGDDAEPMAQAA